MINPGRNARAHEFYEDVLTEPLIAAGESKLNEHIANALGSFGMMSLCFE